MHLRTTSGIGLVEIVVVAGIISIVFLGLVQLAVLTLRPIETSVRQAEATFLAEEGIEAMKVLRNEGWATYVDPLTNGATYYPTIASDRWTLTTTDPGPINNIYTRTVVLTAVNRDSNDDIAPTGTLDEDTRHVVATVTWDERGNSQSVVVETYIANFLDT